MKVKDGDGDGHTWGIYYGTNVPRNGTYCAGVRYDSIQANEDWLISPAFNVPIDATAGSYNFWAKSMDPSYLETFEVQVSTDNGSSWISHGSIVDVPDTYTEYTLPIVLYAGQTIRLLLSVFLIKSFIFLLMTYYALQQPGAEVHRRL